MFESKLNKIEKWENLENKKKCSEEMILIKTQVSVMEKAEPETIS